MRRLLVAKGSDGIEARGARGRIKAGQDTDKRSKDKSAEGKPRGDYG
jgi:hypothetical protein